MRVGSGDQVGVGDTSTVIDVDVSRRPRWPHRLRHHHQEIGPSIAVHGRGNSQAMDDALVLTYLLHIVCVRTYVRYSVVPVARSSPSVRGAGISEERADADPHVTLAAVLVYHACRVVRRVQSEPVDDDGASFTRSVGQIRLRNGRGEARAAAQGQGRRRRRCHWCLSLDDPGDEQR